MSTSPLLRLVLAAGLLLSLGGLGCDTTAPPASVKDSAKEPPPPEDQPPCCCDAPARETAGPAASDEKAPTPPPPATPTEAKRVALNPAKTLFFERLPDGRRRVLFESSVCLRQGMLELLLCRKQSKEHESILHADVDARAVHAALEAAGAKPGSTVRYEPEFKPPSGTTIHVLLEYTDKGKTVTVPAQEWVRNMKTQKAMTQDWVFAGSLLVENPDDKNALPYYAANAGDIICVSNFSDAMLDLPINSPKDNSELAFDAFTDHIPPLGTKVMVILEPVLPAAKPGETRKP
jgi:hypothetical protein